jgi:hypothetical protein
MISIRLMEKSVWVLNVSSFFLSIMFETFFTSIINGQEVERGGNDWIDLAQERERGQAL